MLGQNLNTVFQWNMNQWTNERMNALINYLIRPYGDI